MSATTRHTITALRLLLLVLISISCNWFDSRCCSSEALVSPVWKTSDAPSLPAKDTRRIHEFPLYLSDRIELQNDDDTANLDNGIRLNKVFKATHSRRQADALIDSGRVAVNGIPVTERGGFKVRPFIDVVSLDGKTIEGWEAMNGMVANHDDYAEMSSSGTRNDDESTTTNNRVDDVSTSNNFEYIKYWKPRGVTCTTDRTVPFNIIDDLQQERGYCPKHRVYPVGRLDKDTSGLIVLTSDGRLPNSALRGQFKQPKVYRVIVNRELQDEDLHQLRQGVVITTVAQRDGNRGKPLTAPTLPCRVERIPHTQQRGVTMTLVEGRNRQIRKMMQTLGYEVVRLHRVQFMGISLEPLQREGEWVDLNEEEMRIVEEVLQNADETVESK